MKKFLTLFVVAGLAIFLVGCGEPAPDAANTTVAPEKETVKTGESQGAVTQSDVSTE